MKIRGLLAGLLVAVVLGGCTRSATAPEASTRTAVSGPRFDGSTTPPPPDTLNRGGGTMGNGH
jgi:hypothetical protein